MKSDRENQAQSHLAWKSHYCEAATSGHKRSMECSHLQLFEVLPFGNHDFIPDYLDPFLRVHGQEGIVYPRDVPLIDLEW